jgi:hypothetical protein
MVCAQDGSLAAEPRTWFELHGTLANWSMLTQGDSGYGSSTATAFSAENDLGLPRQRTIPGLSFGRRIGQRWRIELEHTSVRRRGTAVLQRDLAVDGEVFVAGTPLQSDLGLSTLRINAGWSFLKSAQAEAGLIIGGQWLSTSRRFQGTAVRVDFSAPPGSPPTAQAARSSSSGDLAPQALLGLFGSTTIAPEWQIQGRMEVVEAGNINASLGARWQANRHLSLALGYQFIRYELDEVFGFIACCSHLVLNARIHGPQLSLGLAF